MFRTPALCRFRRRPGQPSLIESFGIEKLNYHPGDWRMTPLLGNHWNHLTATRKDIQMVIRYERVEMEAWRARNAKNYLNKLVNIARRRKHQPYYSNQQLTWWLGAGGVPANHFHHERFEEQPLKEVPGMAEKFMQIVERSDDKELATYQFLGTYDLKYFVDAGDGYAEGIGKDPETYLYPEDPKSSKEIGIVEVKGMVFKFCQAYL